MTETFKTTINLIDLSEMKKFEFKDSPLTNINEVRQKKIEKLVIYKPNICNIKNPLIIQN